MAPTAAEQCGHQHKKKAVGLAAHDPSGHLSPLAITHRSTGDDDVVIKILYCGICHSDLHSIKNEWADATYPLIPGHEIVGVETEVGKNVTKFKAGDRVGVGCMVNSCQSCESGDLGFENQCKGMIFTYNSVDHDGTVTYGGYSSAVVVHERFVVRFPNAMPLDKDAPLLCAGITVYGPMKYHGLNVPGMHVSVLGLGRLGHIAVKFDKVFGMKVTVISSSPGKKQEALELLGADAFIVSKNTDEIKLEETINLTNICTKNKILAGSCIGGMSDTQEMLDVAAKHGVMAEIEVVGTDYMNTALERLAKADIRYRFIIDIANTLDKVAGAATE